MQKQQSSTKITKSNGRLSKFINFGLSNPKLLFFQISQHPYIAIAILCFLAFVSLKILPDAFWRIRGIRGVIGTLFILAYIVIINSNKRTRVYFFWFNILPVLSTFIVVIVLSLLLEIINWGVPKELLGVLITALATIAAVFVGSIHKSKLDVEQERLKEKVIPVYENLIDFLVEVKDKNNQTEKQERLINKLDKQIWRWGSYEVKSYWNEIQPVLISRKVFDLEMQTKIIQMVQAIRKQAELPNEPDTQLRKLLNQSEVEKSKSVKENLAESRHRRRIDPAEFGFPDSTFLIREDRDR